MARAVSQQNPHTRRSPARAHAGKAGATRGRSSVGSTGLARAFELAALVESTSDAVVGVSPVGLVTGWGAGATRLFGYASEEILGRHVSTLAPGDRRQEPDGLIERVNNGARIEGLETERIAKDGTVLKVLLSIAPIAGDDGEFVGAVGIYRDLSPQRGAEEALRASERRYHLVVEALSEGVVMQDRDGIILASNKSAESILGRSAGELQAGSRHRRAATLIREDGSPLRADDHPSMVSLRTGQPQLGVVIGFDGPGADTLWLSVNSYPLVSGDARDPYATVSSFTDITELRRTLGELHEARFEDLRRLALMAEYRDDDTNKHTERVARTAALLAAELGLDSELVSTIQRAAPLHDVGKVGISDEILLKPGKLTAEEFDVMKTHTIIGGRILCESRFPVVRMAMEIAFTHHERWDGGGYPTGLREEGIPITGRIVAVADAFDAMTHARPYKGALAVEHAVAEIERCSATQFDPRVVEAFMRLDHHSLVDVTCS
jgi:putative two-component system response regulator